jgi:hypothetical protein
MIFFLIFIIETLTDDALFDISDTVVMMKIKFGLVYKLLAIMALLHIDFNIMNMKSCVGSII